MRGQLFWESATQQLDILMMDILLASINRALE
jgi:hypothetical protein